MKPDFTQINRLRREINELEIKLRIKKDEIAKLAADLGSFDNMSTEDLIETLKKLHKKSQRLRKERERIEERTGKELDKID